MAYVGNNPWGPQQPSNNVAIAISVNDGSQNGGFATGQPVGFRPNREVHHHHHHGGDGPEGVKPPQKEGKMERKMDKMSPAHVLFGADTEDTKKYKAYADAAGGAGRMFG